MGSYVPSGMSERAEMLQKIGVSSIEELYAAVPAEMLVKDLKLPQGKSELEVSGEMTAISEKNKVFKTILRGAGAYDHYIPAIVKSVTSKEQLVTAYTPYQAEISQGILQSIFEYQTMICSLTGMDVSNASVYDGATAMAESVAMCKERKKTKAYISATVNPQYLEVVRTYCSAAGTDLTVIPEKDGKTDIEALKAAMGADAACFLSQQPNFYGIMEDCTALAEATHAAGAKYVLCCNPISLAICKTPAEYGADVAVGEGQPLGMPIAFGGPYLGFMATKTAMQRKLPGRIVGETVDVEGKRGFVLTLQAREQHIRREKASSNICSNQALCALTASVYLSAMGEGGLKQAAKLCTSKAHYFASELTKIEGVELVYDAPYFHEFVTTLPKSAEVLSALENAGILGGLETEKGVLWCVTEKVSKAELDRAVAIVKEVLA
ncbi:MAG: aminomethyl-transferring glycine dehydrogenase subunit GcvPA [Clostridia bacterium]|nr:aminomethyl-transferring glycine dehydrogenase subunit GcvPA [Clostridia bacterium]MBQ8400152.1 aminomethyl-transferring glycine dehydrogenase subunit GcvPA [Clostridia bacterium]